MAFLFWLSKNIHYLPFYMVLICTALRRTGTAVVLEMDKEKRLQQNMPSAKSVFCHCMKNRRNFIKQWEEALHAQL